MADSGAHNWDEIEDDFWSLTMRTRAEEDRVMRCKFDTKKESIMRQIGDLFNDHIFVQLEEAIRITAVRREVMDETSRAWFRHSKIPQDDADRV